MSHPPGAVFAYAWDKPVWLGSTFTIVWSFGKHVHSKVLARLQPLRSGPPRTKVTLSRSCGHLHWKHAAPYVLRIGSGPHQLTTAAFHSLMTRAVRLQQAVTVPSVP